MNTTTISLDSLKELNPHDGDRIEGVIQGDYAILSLKQDQPYNEGKADAIDRFLEKCSGVISNPTNFSVDSDDPRLAYLARKHLG